MLVRRLGPAAGPVDARPALFVDRDGVLNRRVVDGYVLNPDDLVILDAAGPILLEAVGLGTPIVIVSNQGCLSRGLLTEETLDAIHDRLLRYLADAGVSVDAIYICPHHPAAVDPGDRSCDCRKPLPGLILAAADQLCLDLARSVFLGDQESDRQAAEAAGIPADAFFLVAGEDLSERRVGQIARTLHRAVSEV